MSKEKFVIDESTLQTGTRIVAVGGGGNMIGHMIKEGFKGIEFTVAKIKPSAGKESALESYDELRISLGSADIVFILAGLGGGTGTGAAPVVAKIAKEIGILTIAVVTTPFKFEGNKRRKLAEKGLEDLKKVCDSIVVIPNDRLLSIIDKRLSLRESFEISDSVLAQAVSGISGFALSNSKNDINLDFADLQTVMGHGGLAFMGVGEHTGENAAYEAIKSAMESPLLDNMPINGAMGVLVHFHINPEFHFMEITEAMEVVLQSADEDADVIFGTTADENMPVNCVRITLVATGFERDPLKAVNNINYLPILPET